VGRALKESGLQSIREDGVANRRLLGPRIVTRRAGRGFHHPVSKKEVLQLLEAVGPVACYGLRSVEFVRRPRDGNLVVPVFGRYQVPGRLLLYEQPLSPWRLPGLLEASDLRRLKQAGALVTLSPDAGAALVEWPKGTLQRFILEEVLLHELGHHVLQHNKGKRPARIARTRDHERFAATFAAKQRMALRTRSGFV
jgi:hypothetical protein